MRNGSYTILISAQESSSSSSVKILMRLILFVFNEKVIETTVTHDRRVIVLLTEADSSKSRSEEDSICFGDVFMRNKNFDDPKIGI
jgi:hypothetical protein